MASLKVPDITRGIMTGITVFSQDLFRNNNPASDCYHSAVCSSAFMPSQDWSTGLKDTSLLQAQEVFREGQGWQTQQEEVVWDMG